MMNGKQFIYVSKQSSCFCVRGPSGSTYRITWGVNILPEEVQDFRLIRTNDDVFEDIPEEKAELVEKREKRRYQKKNKRQDHGY